MFLRCNDFVILKMLQQFFPCHFSNVLILISAYGRRLLMAFPQLNQPTAYTPNLSMQPLPLEVILAGILYGKCRSHNVFVPFYGVLLLNTVYLLEHSFFLAASIVKIHVYFAKIWLKHKCTCFLYVQKGPDGVSYWVVTTPFMIYFLMLIPLHICSLI